MRAVQENVEEIFVRGKGIMCSRFSEESRRIPFLTLSMESPIIAAHWAMFMLPNKYADEFEVSPHMSGDGKCQNGIAVVET